MTHKRPFQPVYSKRKTRKTNENGDARTIEHSRHLQSSAQGSIAAQKDRTKPGKMEPKTGTAKMLEKQCSLMLAIARQHSSVRLIFPEKRDSTSRTTQPSVLIREVTQRRSSGSASPPLPPKTRGTMTSPGETCCCWSRSTGAAAGSTRAASEAERNVAAQQARRNIIAVFILFLWQDGRGEKDRKI